MNAIVDTLLSHINIAGTSIHYISTLLITASIQLNSAAAIGTNHSSERS